MLYNKGASSFNCSSLFCVVIKFVKNKIMPVSHFFLVMEFLKVNSWERNYRIEVCECVFPSVLCRDSSDVEGRDCHTE